MRGLSLLRGMLPFKCLHDNSNFKSSCYVAADLHGIIYLQAVIDMALIHSGYLAEAGLSERIGQGS